METKSQEVIKGTIERVTFHQSDTGFCVLRVLIPGRRDVVSVVGKAAAVTAGESVIAQGMWINDRQYGLQFSAEILTLVPPTSLEGIQKYLGSGMIKGIGAHFAKKLVRAFGEHVFDVIEQTPERLAEVPGIGQKRQTQLIEAWREQKMIRHIMVFLQSHGIGTARAVRIYKTYGDHAIQKVQENPYCLAQEIRGIGFKTADQLAERLGIDKHALIRAQAGIGHVLAELCESGHCAAMWIDLIAASEQLLEIPVAILEEGLTHEIAAGRVIRDGMGEMSCLYPASLYHAEVKSAALLKQLLGGEPPWGVIDTSTAIPWVEKETNLSLSTSQKQAIESVLSSKVSIITGGPGVGKTTLVNSLLKIIRAKSQRVALCAPTGRAAKRLTETTGIAAKTIHRLLQFDPKTYGFKHHQDNPLQFDVVVIDESSMLDIVLLSHVLKAIPRYAALIFVGDIDQLPSVGSGAVLADMIASQQITTVRLTEVFRQASTSQIIVNAHRVNQGWMPGPNDGLASDFYTLYMETAEEIQAQLIEVVCTRLPKRYDYHPIHDIQVLTPMKRGSLGAQSLNIALQQRLNGHSEPKVSRFGITFAPGDKVIQMTNNYQKEVFNGDIGLIEHIDLEAELVKIRFDHGVKLYQLFELDEVNLAYAISIHKSQGSEFPVVVLPISTQHFTLLARNLLYTAITRGKRLVVMIAQKRAVGMAVKNAKELNRLTKLSSRLQAE